MKQKNILSFPEDFIWGTAVCSHQVEGHNIHSDWWAWEQKGNKIKDGTVSGVACDQWNLYEEDFALMKQFNFNGYRMSIEWAKIEPQKGKWDKEAINHYKKMLSSLKDKGIKVCLTLYHWPLPLWVARAGGWTNDKSVEWFCKYVDFVVHNIYDLVELWCTLNEPIVSIGAGYVAGEFPPEKKNLILAIKVFRNLLKAHVKAYQSIHNYASEKGKKKKPMTGIAAALGIFAPADPNNPIDKFISDAGKYLTNDAFLMAMDKGKVPFPFGFDDKIKGLARSFEYIGINYYTRHTLKVNPLKPDTMFIERIIPEGIEINEMGWEIYPEGFYEIVKEISQYGVPIYITENGIADASDTKRPHYILTHLKQLHNAISDGFDVRGYFHWSFIDNFEWKEGYAKKLGLIAMEHPDLTRKPRKSAYLYSDIIKANGITREIVKKYVPKLEKEIFEI